MPANDRCPNCGTRRPATAPAGLCPQCLLRLGLGDDLSNAREGTLTISRAAGGPTASVLDVLAAAAGPIPRVALRETEAASTEPLERPDSPEMPDPVEGPARLQLFGEIARGGMGAILRGRDPDLGREVAVKVLLDGHRNKPDLVRRFVEEAQIGGQLQHPGVVPVYELGTFGGSRPYFVMKLVKGRTFAALLSERRGLADGLPRLLAVFSQVAETVAYAHARGVIHRDLKPSNVMVGSFGEVQVMDWGLAKVLRRGGTSDDETAGKLPDQETGIATARSESDADRSLAGSVMGTPAYMAPEQARGEVDRLDERVDVFALGSILCEVLTGQPAFTGRDTAGIQRLAARGDTADALARLEGNWADAELVALARDCLAVAPEDRLRDAAAVARQLSDYTSSMRERLRQAELSRSAEQARAEEARRTAAAADARARAERRARRMTAALAVAVLGLAALGGGGYAWYAGQRQERLGRVRDLLAEAEAARRQADADTTRDPLSWQRARGAVDRASEALGGTSDRELAARLRALKSRVVAEAERAERVGALVSRLEIVRGSHAEWWSPRRTDTEYAKVFRAFGLDLDVADPREAGAVLAKTGAGVEIAASIDEWAWLRRRARGGGDPAAWGRLVEVARAADPDGWRDALRVRLGRRDAAELRELASAEGLASQPAPSLLLLGRALMRAGEPERAADLFRSAWRRSPGDFWNNYELGHSSWIPTSAGRYTRPDEAIRFLTAAVGIRPASAMAHVALGDAVRGKGDLDEAIAAYREVIRLRPDLGMAHSNLGAALRQKGRPAEAIAAFQEAIRVQPDFAVAHYNLGNALRDQGKPGEAMVEYREAIRLQPDLAAAHYSLGNELRGQDRLGEAIAEYRAAIRLQPEYPEAHCNLGHLLRQQGRFVEALTELKRGHELGSKDPRWRYPSEQWVQHAERLVALERKLPALLSGEARTADATDSVALARLCYDKKRYATAVRFWADAFKGQPGLAEDLRAENCYGAACAAALAAAGQGTDDPKPDDAARAMLRGQALDWLKAERAAWANALDSGHVKAGPVVRRMLEHWQADSDLAGVRDVGALAKLPEAERGAWRSLWAEVDALRARVRGGRP